MQEMTKPPSVSTRPDRRNTGRTGGSGKGRARTAGVFLSPGTLRIVPNEGLQAILRRDYQQMREMFPDTPLTFEEILTRLEALERRVNSLKRA